MADQAGKGEEEEGMVVVDKPEAVATTEAVEVQQEEAVGGSRPQRGRTGKNHKTR